MPPQSRRNTSIEVYGRIDTMLIVEIVTLLFCIIFSNVGERLAHKYINMHNCMSM